MKIIIDIPDTAYEAYKEWHKNKVATVEQSLIANGTPLPEGEWIRRHKQNSFGQDVVCFECNKCGEYKVPLYHLLITEPLKVCPNCGADMRSVDGGLQERAVSDLHTTIDDTYKKLRGTD